MGSKPLTISEAGTVQFPMVKHAVEIGWKAVAPEVARTWRGGEAGTFFREVLEAKLASSTRGYPRAPFARSSRPSTRCRRPSRATGSCWRGCAASVSGTTRWRSVTGR